jgi:transposase
VAALTVPDNTRTAVVDPCRYEPLLHRTYEEMAEHYGTVILPARIKKPRDKAKVESAVQVAQRQILATLRDMDFFALAELNQAIEPRLREINAQPFQKLDGSRDQWFETLDRPKLHPLPCAPFVVASWLEVGVNIDYHAVVDHHYYSVPYGLIHQRLQVRLTDGTVEFFHKTKRVAVHPRSFQRGLFTTLDEHRPKAHQRYLEWTPGRIVEWARKIGPQCALVVQKVFSSKPHPEQGFRSCMGIIRLAKHFDTVSYRSIESILDKRLESQPLQGDLGWSSPDHENVRGQTYFA